MPRPLLLTLPLLLLACGGEGPLSLLDRSSVAGAGGGSGSSGQPGAGGAGGLYGGSGGSSVSGSGGAPGAGAGGSAGGSGGVSGGSGGSGGDAGAAGQGGAGAPIRTVSKRSIFGNVKAPDNLLWDGDFEWQGPFVSQYSWAIGKSWVPGGVPEIRALPACRSGLKCATLPKSATMGGLAVSPRTPTTKIRGWARVGAESLCDRVNLHLSSCFDNDKLTDPAKPMTEGPDAEGWCGYEDERPTLETTPCLFVFNKAKGEVLVDDLYLGPGSGPPVEAKTTAVDPATEEQVKQLREGFRARRRGQEQAPRVPPTSFPRVR